MISIERKIVDIIRIGRHGGDSAEETTGKIIRLIHQHCFRVGVNMPADVAEFHAKFELTQRAKDAAPSQKVMAFRLKFLLEELDELAMGANQRDLVQTTDAIIDIIYVALGLAWLLNLPIDDAWREVHKANMRKERAKSAADSKRGSSFDIVKPPGWKPPNLSQFFSAADLAHKKQPDPQAPQHDLIDYLNQVKQREAHEQDTRDNTA